MPKLAEPKPFSPLDPATLNVAPEEAARNVAAKIGRKVDVDEMKPVDLIVCGSVAVNWRGVRLGKGAGYSDIEVALLQEAGLIGPNTTIVTTVHPLQVVDDEPPETEHDSSLDVIVTPEAAMRPAVRDLVLAHQPWSTRGRLQPQQPVLEDEAAAWLRSCGPRFKQIHHDGDLTPELAAERPRAGLDTYHHAHDSSVPEPGAASGRAPTAAGSVTG